MTENKTKPAEDYSIIENFVSALNIEVEEVPDDMVKTSHVGYKPKKQKELSPLGFKYNVDLKKEWLYNSE